MALFVVNVSSVQDFMQCRYRWLCKWVRNRVPRYEGPALDTGKMIHRIFERHELEGIPLQSAAFSEVYVYQAVNAMLRDERQREIGQKVIDTVHGLYDAWPLWHDTYPMDIPSLEVEQSFEITFPQLPGVTFRGRPDRVCVMNGLVWHVQNRGLAANMNFATYARLAKRHMHEHLYAEHLAEKYARDGDYGGTLFNLVRKLKFRTYVGKKNEKTRTAAEMFWQHPMSIELASDQHARVMRDLFYHVREMQRVIDHWETSRVMPAPNDKLNGGFNGSSEDPFFKLLIGEISLHDDKHFKDREDTYAIADTGTE